MKKLLSVLAYLHAVAALIFVLAAVVLMITALRTGWSALYEGFTPDVAVVIIEYIGLAAVAVVGLQIAQTIIEEEVIREAHVSAPTRVRRFLSRFLVVVVVALAIEGMIATFKALREDMQYLLHAAAFIFSVGTLLAGWGVFVHLNRSAEELEPEAMAEAKSEDKKVQ